MSILDYQRLGPSRFRICKVKGGLSYEKGIYNDNGELAGDLWVWGRNRCIGEHEHAKVGVAYHLCWQFREELWL